MHTIRTAYGNGQAEPVHSDALLPEAYDPHIPGAEAARSRWLSASGIGADAYRAFKEARTAWRLANPERDPRWSHDRNVWNRACDAAIADEAAAVEAATRVSRSALDDLLNVLDDARSTVRGISRDVALAEDTRARQAVKDLREALSARHIAAHRAGLSAVGYRTHPLTMGLSGHDQTLDLLDVVVTRGLVTNGVDPFAEERGHALADRKRVEA